MMKIIYIFVIIGTVYALSSEDSVNQRDPVQIKLSNDEPIPVSKDELLSTLEQDLIDPSDPAMKDEHLEPAESNGFGYGGWGRGFGGYGGYVSYGGWGRGGYGGWRRGGYGGYGRRWYG